MPNADEITLQSTGELLRQYVAILDELLRRGVIRTRNAPAGDLAERIVAIVYDGELAPNSAKSWDVRASDGRRIQVKSRVMETNVRRGFFSPFRSWDFEACIFLIFDGHTYEVAQAVEVSTQSVIGLARRTEWVAASRVRVQAPLLQAPGAEDITHLAREAFAGL